MKTNKELRINNKNVLEFMQELDNAPLEYAPRGTCNSQQCGGVRSKIH